MSATYPASKKTFSQIVDGVTFMQAVNVNTAYNEIEAIQTFLGSLGSGNTQGFASALLTTLTNYRMGAVVSYNAADTINVSAGGLVLTGDSGKFRCRYNSSVVTANWSNLDTGEEGNATYYVWATADDEETTFDIKISLSAVAPQGYVYYRLLGSFINSTDIIIGSINNDDNVSSGFQIKQIVQTQIATAYALTGSMADVTGLTLTITPKSTSNKVLILVSGDVCDNVGTDDSSWSAQLLRGASSLSMKGATKEGYGGRMQNGSFAMFYLDSPATVAATTYKIQATGTTNLQICNATGTQKKAEIIAIEISGV